MKQILFYNSIYIMDNSIYQIKCFCIITYIMKQNRKNWSLSEDQTIMSLVKKYGTKRWTLISDKMKQRFPQDGRSGKQCRERWHNHLSPIINKQPWTQQEIKLVFDTHRQYGNKWTQIAQLLPGRTDNAVKNQFYSTLRKGLRRICKILGTRNSTTRIKKIKPSALSSLITNFTQLNIGDVENEEELYEMLFEFSNGDRYEEFREKEVTEKYKQKMEKLLQKIIDSKQCSKKRRTKNTNKQNKQSQNENYEQMESQQDKQKQNISEQKNEEVSEQKQKENSDENNKFEFNINLEDRQQQIDNKMNDQIYDPDFGEMNCPNIYEELDSRLEKPISLKKQNSLAESIKDDQNLPLLKKKHSYQLQRFPKRNQNYLQIENTENYFQNFLSKSPNFCTRFKMPTPKVQDGYSNGMFYHTFGFDHRDDEPVEKYCNSVVEEVKASIKANTQGRNQREKARNQRDKLRQHRLR